MTTHARLIEILPRFHPITGNLNPKIRDKTVGSAFHVKDVVQTITSVIPPKVAEDKDIFYRDEPQRKRTITLSESVQKELRAPGGNRVKIVESSPERNVRNLPYIPYKSDTDETSSDDVPLIKL